MPLLHRPLLPPEWLVLHLLAQLGLHRWLPLATLLHPPWTRLALLPLVAGLMLNVCGIRGFFRRDTPLMPFTESTVLLTEGPYRFSRNPIYLGFTLLLVAGALYLGTLSPWLAVVSFFLVLRQQYVLREEALLRARFGPEYEEFTRRVRRWL